MICQLSARVHVHRLLSVSVPRFNYFAHRFIGPLSLVRNRTSQPVVVRFKLLDLGFDLLFVVGGL